MEVRCFEGDYDHLEKYINEFIEEEKPKIKDIKLTGTSRVTEKDDIVYMALVMFEP